MTIISLQSFHNKLFSKEVDSFIQINVHKRHLKGNKMLASVNNKSNKYIKNFIPSTKTFTNCKIWLSYSRPVL